MARKALTAEQIDSATSTKRMVTIILLVIAFPFALIGLLMILPQGVLDTYVDFSDYIKGIFDA